MVSFALWSLYVAVAVMVPAFVGFALCGSDARLDLRECVGIFFLAVMWPLVLALILCFAVSVAALYLPALAVSGLVRLGSAFGAYMSRGACNEGGET